MEWVEKFCFACDKKLRMYVITGDSEENKMVKCPSCGSINNLVDLLDDKAESGATVENDKNIILPSPKEKPADLSKLKTNLEAEKNRILDYEEEDLSDDSYDFDMESDKAINKQVEFSKHIKNYENNVNVIDNSDRAFNDSRRRDPQSVIRISREKNQENSSNRLKTMFDNFGDKKISDLTVGEFSQLIKEIISEESLYQDVSIADKWQGGKLILQPGHDGLKEKELPIEAFFHKIVLMRERLRILEQRINANPRLSEPEKIDIQQYITKIYGTLTTFNILFKYKVHYFVGEKSFE